MLIKLPKFLYQNRKKEGENPKYITYNEAHFQFLDNRTILNIGRMKSDR